MPIDDSPQKSKQPENISPDDDNSAAACIARGKKMIEAERIVAGDMRSKAERDKAEKDDAERWRNEG